MPAGSEHLAPGEGVLLVHYWAPWERRGAEQARGLDSLRRALPPGSVRVLVVCFDPYPSVARYVARLRLRLPVLLDPRHELERQLPCPSIPFTYVVDRGGRIAVAQAGEVDWLSPATRGVIETLVAAPALPHEPGPTPRRARTPEAHRTRTPGRARPGRRTSDGGSGQARAASWERRSSAPRSSAQPPNSAAV